MVVPEGTLTSRPSIVSVIASLMTPADWRSPDWTMLAAVWPSPQIEASRIARATSPSSPDTSSPRREPREQLDLALGADAAGHALAAGLVGEELGAAPDASRMSAVSSRTTIAPDPTVAPRGRRPSALSGRSRSAGAQHGGGRAPALDRAQAVAGADAAAPGRSALRSVVPDGIS